MIVKYCLVYEIELNNKVNYKITSHIDELVIRYKQVYTYLLNRSGILKVKNSFGIR